MKYSHDVPFRLLQANIKIILNCDKPTVRQLSGYAMHDQYFQSVNRKLSIHGNLIVPMVHGTLEIRIS